MNPFTDWKPEQQCKGAFARDISGNKTMASYETAVQWCAYGRIFLYGIPDKTAEKFTQFLKSKHGPETAIAFLNDDKDWTPSRFAAAWDEFEKESHAR
jgi:hypothetical protein